MLAFFAGAAATELMLSLQFCSTSTDGDILPVYRENNHCLQQSQPLYWNLLN